MPPREAHWVWHNPVVSFHVAEAPDSRKKKGGQIKKIPEAGRGDICSCRKDCENLDRNVKDLKESP